MLHYTFFSLTLLLLFDVILFLQFSQIFSSAEKRASWRLESRLPSVEKKARDELQSTDVDDDFRNETVHPAMPLSSALANNTTTTTSSQVCAFVACIIFPYYFFIGFCFIFAIWAGVFFMFFYFLANCFLIFSATDFSSTFCCLILFNNWLLVYNCPSYHQITLINILIVSINHLI